MMPEANRQRLQVLAQPAGKTAGWIDRPDHVQQDDQGVVYLIAVFAAGKGDP
jgi:4-hydroxy-3-methylbut-2-enyl diphosphate reductase IspH